MAGVRSHMLNNGTSYKPEDLEDYIKFIAVNRGCLVESVDRNKAHWNFIMTKTLVCIG